MLLLKNYRVMFIIITVLTEDETANKQILLARTISVVKVSIVYIAPVW